MTELNILIVDDEAVQRETLADILRSHGYPVTTAADAKQAIVLLQATQFDLVLSDFRMPGGSGLDVTRKVRELSPETVVFIMTAYAEISGVIEAMSIGVLDYLLKPINIEALLSKLQFLNARRDLMTEVTYLRHTLRRSLEHGRLVGESPAMTAIKELITQIAPTASTVLITGESGTGKEVTAQQIHNQSDRAKKRLVVINCGAIPENLLESELFGYKKGAFSGATCDKDGLISFANEGTLFLDEIGELPKNLQVKLLRVLQEREIVPLGGHQPQKIDLRLICATNRDLMADVQTGAFRKDLYYRINVIELKMPPLRERPSDIPALAEAAIARLSQQMKMKPKLITKDVLQRLMAYEWPGNVRELENVLERALILSRDPERIDVSALPVSFQVLGDNDTQVLDLEGATRQFAKVHIAKVLEAKGGNKKEAAEVLGMSLSSLYRKLEDFAGEPPSSREGAL